MHTNSLNKRISKGSWRFKDKRELWRNWKLKKEFKK